MLNQDETGKRANRIAEDEVKEAFTGDPDVLSQGDCKKVSAIAVDSRFVAV